MYISKTALEGYLDHIKLHIRTPLILIQFYCAHRSNYIHETMNILTIVYTTAELNTSVPEDKQGDVMNLFHSTDMGRIASKKLYE